jgi:ApbE superfamily uncharacterized protein (UPF0280 family)
MKSNKYQYRFYRNWVKAGDLCLTRIVDRETDLQILTNKAIDKDFLQEKIRQYRWDIENYIIKDKGFLATLRPVEVETNATMIVRAMGEAAKLAQVGPMAAVAGAIAGFLGRDLLKAGYKEVIIENGGDIFLASRKVRVVGIYSGRVKLWQGLGLKIRPKTTPVGICTSSGKVGHSLSFGSAECVVILSKDVALADAVATATANRINAKEDMHPALNFARSIKKICGIVIIFKNNLASWGEIELVR